MTASPPALPADLEDGLRRLKLAAMRRLTPELLLTAKTQRWAPEEFWRASNIPDSGPYKVRSEMEDGECRNRAGVSLLSSRIKR